MGYRFLDHTADLRLEIEAATLPELFADALQGFTDAFTELEEVGDGEELSIELEAETAADLLHDWLDELLFRFETEERLFRRATVTLTEQPGGLKLAAQTWGERYEPERHGLKLLLKAVTNQGLVVETTARGFRAEVIFDI